MKRAHGSSRASLASIEIDALLATLEDATPNEKAETLVGIATRFRDDLEDPGQAIDALLEAWKSDPTCEGILENLEPLLHTEGRWTEILDITRELALRMPSPLALVYTEAMVRWLTRDVPEPILAMQWLERIRQQDPTHWQLHMHHAAQAREHGDLKRELEHLDRAVLSVTRSDDRARIHLLMGERFLDERTQDFAAARKHFLAAHALVPRAIAPLRGLQQLAEQQRDNVSLADVLRLQENAEIGNDERIAVLLWRAKIEEEEFRKADVAAKTLERAIALAPAHPVALEALERTYGAARAWSDLAVVLERAAVSAEDPHVRRGRLERLGEVLEAKIGDLRSAIATYERLAQKLPDDETILGALARATEKVGDIRAAIRYREQLAELSTVPSVRARMHVLAGQLLVPSDPVAARSHFERAVSFDATNEAALRALLWDARDEGDTERAERYLEHRARHTDAPRARATAFVELAQLRLKRDDEAGAQSAFEQAAEADPTNETAAAALVNTLVAHGLFAKAEPLCEVAVAAAERDKRGDTLASLRIAQAKIAMALGNPERALIAALAAHVIRPDSPSAQEALIDAAIPMKASPQIHIASDALIAISENAEALSADRIASLAGVLLLLGETEIAGSLYERVLALLPHHAEALLGLSQHHAFCGNVHDAHRLRRRLAQANENPEVRFAALVNVAESAAKTPGLENFLAETYEEARSLQPQDLTILHRLLSLYGSLKDWRALYGVLRSITESDTDPTRKAKTFLAMAQLAHQELNEAQSALGLFEQALDADSSLLTAFEQLVRILTENRDWPRLEQAYRRMIIRTESGGGTNLQFALYKQIGLIYRDRLHDFEKAIGAYQAAVQIHPKDEQAQTMLRELLARTGRNKSAVAITLDRVLRDPLEPSPYPALFDLLVAQGDVERAQYVASAMNFLGIAHGGARAMHAIRPQVPIEEIPLELGVEGYRELLDADMDPSLTTIFEIVAPSIIELSLSRLPIRNRLSHPGPRLEGHDWLTDAVARAGTILGSFAPRVFSSRHPAPALVPVATRPPSLVAHPAALEGVSSEIVAFLIGKRVLEISKPLLARALCPSLTELKGLAQSAARIANNQAESGDRPLQERLKREDIAALKAAIERARSTAGKLDVLTWSRRADLAACRAGLLLSGDLEAARGGIALDPQSPSDLGPREKMTELLAWFLSDAHATLRRRLGIAQRQKPG